MTFCILVGHGLYSAMRCSGVFDSVTWEEEAKQERNIDAGQTKTLNVGGEWKNVFKVHWVRR